MAKARHILAGRRETGEAPEGAQFRFPKHKMFKRGRDRKMSDHAAERLRREIRHRDYVPSEDPRFYGFSHGITVT
jgi:hypothetical protein